MNPKRHISLPNKHLEKFDSDFLYHLGYDNKTTNLEDIFGDVKFVCMGGTRNRMFQLAKYIQKVLNESGELVDLCEKAHRFAVFKVGPVICASHGIGMPSMSILLHEMIKLVTYANCKDPIFLRIGTSGGLGIPVGTVVVTKDAYNGYIKNEHELAILGQRVCRPAKFHEEIYNILLSCVKSSDDFETILGNTMASDDFYEGGNSLRMFLFRLKQATQYEPPEFRPIAILPFLPKVMEKVIHSQMPSYLTHDKLQLLKVIVCHAEDSRFKSWPYSQGRLDGAICSHSEKDKMEFLKKLHDHGVRNIEMEATMFSSLTHHVGIKAGEVCVTLVDRLKGDQVTQAKEPKHILEQRPLIIVGRFIKKILDA